MEYIVRRIPNDELTHYGRKGMKWGQHIFGTEDDRARRYQSKETKKAKKELDKYTDLRVKTEARYKRQGTTKAPSSQKVLQNYRKI